MVGSQANQINKTVSMSQGIAIEAYVHDEHLW